MINMQNNIDLEEYSDEVISAMNLVKANGFLIIKLTDKMKSDAVLCRETKNINKIMDCTECSCNICAVK